MRSGSMLRARSALLTVVFSAAGTWALQVAPDGRQPHNESEQGLLRTDADAHLLRPNRNNKTANEMLARRSGRVAVIVRGQSFRAHMRGHNGPACDPASIGDQDLATKSLFKYVVNPFLGNNVALDMIVTDAPCNLSTSYASMFPHDDMHFLAQGMVVGMDQADSFRRTLAYFMRYMGVNYINVRSYDLVVITRHDIVWKKPIFDSPGVNISKMNFAAPCEKGQSPDCVIDILHMMPGRLFPTFVKANCLMHQCFGTVQKAMAHIGAETGFVLWDAQAGKVRGKNDYYYLYNR